VSRELEGPGPRQWQRRDGVAWGVSRADRRLVERAQQGDRIALEALFDRHWIDAWRLAYRITRRRAMADDVAQDAFERAFAALSRFDPTRPFAPWLHRIVVNRSLDLARSERRLVGLDSGLPTNPQPLVATRLAATRRCSS